MGAGVIVKTNDIFINVNGFSGKTKIQEKRCVVLWRISLEIEGNKIHCSLRRNKIINKHFQKDNP
jgi:hypothetical protein